MYEMQLQQAGLNKNQAIVYQALLKLGAAPARKIISAALLKRGLAYKTLDELVNLGLATKKEAPGEIASFEPVHPGKLKELAEQREQEAKTAQAALSGVLGALVSDYNLACGKPGVRFYEGVEGFRQITQDSLGAKTEIYSYIDNEAVNKYLAKENQEYTRRRRRLGLKKKMIALDTPYVRNRAKIFAPEATEIRVVNIAPFPFETVMQIYDDKISYLTLKPEAMFGVIIEDAHISRMHRRFFEYIWRHALPVMSDSALSPAQTGQEQAKPIAPQKEAA